MKTRSLALCALFAALMAICAWISLPLGPFVFSLQTFAIFLALLVLGGKLGCVSILVYLLLGAVGVPVFTGFRGGFDVFFQPTGGFLVGFILIGLSYRGLTDAFGCHTRIRLLSLLLGTLVCYLLGLVWLGIFLPGSYSGSIAAFILPYLLPDGIKLALAFALFRRLEKHLQ